MKFMSSFSMSSSSSSSSTNFSDQFCTTQSCLAGVLRRIFCSGSLPTYPSDQLKETDPIEVQKLQPSFKAEELNASATPNIVARLMGLDSMPEIDSGKAQKNSTSITRSKSMNSADWRLEREDIEEQQQKQQNRRVKTSFSFRETPNYLEIEDDSFYVLSFENGGEESKEFWPKGANLMMGSKEQKQRRKAERHRVKQRKERNDFGDGRVFSNEKDRMNLKISGKVSEKIENNVNFQISRECVTSMKDSSMPVNRKEGSAEIKVRKKKKKDNCLADGKMETESDSENSSPVSVLDHGEFTSDPEVTSASEEESRLRGSNPRRNLASEIIDECPSDYASGCSTGHHEGLDPNAYEGKHLWSRKTECWRHHHHIDISSKICRLAEKEVLNLDWVYIGRRGEVEEDWGVVGAELGFHIFDQLINDVIDQLVGL
ncbi:hypothetical protein Ancab_007412 [Ancistrocladus abbreviatus]